MGSVWERMILSVMQILPPGMLKEETVSDEVLSTVLAEVVNVLNFKHLSCNSNSPQEEQPITPNYLLHLWSCPSPPPGVFSKDDNSSKPVRWQAQCLASTVFGQPVLAQMDLRVLSYTLGEEKMERDDKEP